MIMKLKIWFNSQIICLISNQKFLPFSPLSPFISSFSFPFKLIFFPSFPLQNVPHEPGVYPISIRPFAHKFPHYRPIPKEKLVDFCSKKMGMEELEGAKGLSGASRRPKKFSFLFYFIIFVSLSLNSLSKMAPPSNSGKFFEQEEMVPKSLDVKRGENANEDAGGMRTKINGKWIWLSAEFVKSHPGGPVLTQYRDAEATHIFHAFHEGSAKAYKQLNLLEAKGKAAEEENGQRNGTNGWTAEKELEFDAKNVIGEYRISIEKEKQIVLEFEKLRRDVHARGLMRPKPAFYVRKVAEVFGLLALCFWLQYRTFYICSAFVLALTWQQMGWLCHEFCHHQPTKNRRFNDICSLLLGNVAQGFSRDWWKDKHNLHHAATNIIQRDGDIDLAPLLALVPDDLGKYKTLISKLLLRFILPYQHWYFSFMYLLLRISWTSQSIFHAFSASSSHFTKHRVVALDEQLTLLAHWFWMLTQLWLLPSPTIRLLFFAISQFGGGLFISLVVSYNHNSVPKFPEHSGLLNNFAALHLLTTRNMRSSPFVDWFWGGLNFQIEHHLFPTMPRPNLPICSKMVRDFCARTGLPYMEDDFATGYLASLRLLRQVSEQAIMKKKKLAE